MDKDPVVIIVTCASKKEAGNIAGALLRKKLVACANIIGGVDSKFWWQGRLDKAREVIVVFKTVSGNFKAASRLVKEIHSYKVPEIIALPIVAGDREYLEWIKKSVK